MSNLLKVNPNRMELLKLNRRLLLAKRGYRLLKDKQDELMERFTLITKKVKDMRKDCETIYVNLKFPYFLAKSLSDGKVFYSYCANPVIKTEISIKERALMGITIPEILVNFTGSTEVLGNLNLSSNFPEFIENFMKLIKKIIILANEEKKMYLISDELQKVRRRVNALEYIFIPKLKETLKYISLMLEEMERENITRLMKIKDIVRKVK